MHACVSAGVAVALALLAVTPAHASAALKAAGGRQYNSAYNYNPSNNNNNNNNGYRHNGFRNRMGYQNAGDSSDGGYQENSLYGGGDYNALLQNYAKNGYYDAYNSADYQDTTAAASSYAAAGSNYAPATENPDSSPALSALALLGFLYFLNLIQDTLQNNNGRRKREADEEDEELPRISRSLSFLEDFFVDLPKILGFDDRSDLERDGRAEATRRTGLDSIAGFFTSRLSLISSIMSFLKDPRPSRVRRAIQENQLDDEGSFDISGALDFVSKRVAHFFREVAQDTPKAFWGMLRRFSRPKDNKGGETEDDLPGTAGESEKDPIPPPSPPPLTLRDGEDGNGEDFVNRVKRFTDGMNSWYEESEGRMYDPDEPKPVGGVVGQILKLLGGNEDLRRSVAIEALPLFEEMSLGLDGAHPHCLQRALCRVNRLASSMSVIPRISLRVLSTNLAEVAPSEALTNENLAAIASGRRGEDCNAVFIGCDRDSENDALASP